MASKQEKEAKKVGNKIVQQFKAGSIAAPIALAVLPVTKDRPIDRWGLPNRLGAMLMGCTDARTYKQWQQVGRQVKKGESASAYIQMAATYPIDKNDPDGDRKFVGWKFKAVFDISVTEGEPVNPVAEAHVHDLPLLEVAEAWGVNVHAADTVSRGAAGVFNSGSNSIGLGVSNLTTWLHELVHKADHKLGNLTEQGQHWMSETVAELGATVLAHMIGAGDQADEGGCWDYVQHYAKEAKIDPEHACLKAINRIGEAVSLILEAAEQVQQD